MLYLVTRESHVRRSLAIALHVTYYRTSYAARTQHEARVKPRDSHTLVVCVACAQSVAVLLFCPPPRFPGGGRGDKEDEEERQRGFASSHPRPSSPSVHLLPLASSPSPPPRASGILLSRDPLVPSPLPPPSRRSTLWLTLGRTCRPFPHSVPSRRT